jgi:hypothetical protein
MNCQSCKYWEFPTKSLYQGIATKGYCTFGEIKETYPDDSCDEGVRTTKRSSAEYRQAVNHALQIVNRERFGKIMNNDTAIADIQKVIDGMKLGNTRNHGGLKGADMPVSTLDKQAKVGDSVFVTHRNQFTVMDIRQVPGAPLQVIVADQHGTLHVFNTTDCEFRMQNE